MEKADLEFAHHDDHYVNHRNDPVDHYDHCVNYHNNPVDIDDHAINDHDGPIWRGLQGCDGGHVVRDQRPACVLR